MTWWKKKNHGQNLARWANKFFLLDSFWRFLEHVRETLFLFHPQRRKERKRKRKKQIDILSLFCVCVWFHYFPVQGRKRKKRFFHRSVRRTLAEGILIWSIPQSARPWISIRAWCMKNITRRRRKKGFTRRDENKNKEEKKKKKLRNWTWPFMANVWLSITRTNKNTRTVVYTCT